MKLKKILLGIVALASIGTTAVAQDIEGGLFLGTTMYQGDLTSAPITLKETKLSVGALGRYYFGPRFNLKGGLYYGQVSGDDKNNPNVPGGVYSRGLNFKSNVFELSVQGELNILPYISNSRRYKFAPYLFGGVGGFYFNPTGTDNKSGKSYALQPLKTEGVSYSLFQVCVPYGLGVKYSLGKFWNLGLEVGQRLIFTDYLDDVSSTYASGLTDPIAIQMSSLQGTKTGKAGAKRGNNKRNDMYMFAGITLTKTIRRFSCSNF